MVATSNPLGMGKAWKFCGWPGGAGGSTVNLAAAAALQPAALHACTRTTQSPDWAAVMLVSDDVGRTPSFRAWPGPCFRQRTQ